MSAYLEHASYSWTKDSVRCINTPSLTARSIFFYVQEAGYFKTFPPYFTERENLDSFLILYTVAGSGLLHYEGEEYRLLPGQCFWIHCMEHHDYAVPKNGKWEFAWLHFNAANALGCYREYVRNGFRISVPADGEGFLRQMQEILSLSRQMFAGSEARISHLISGVLTDLLTADADPSLSPADLPVPIKKAMSFMDRHALEDISLAEIAAAASFSRCHLSHEFHRCTGISLRDYLIQIRLDYAKEQLKYTDRSVNEIAYASGLHSASHFISLFRSRENMTPLAYRRAWKEHPQPLSAPNILP